MEIDRLEWLARAHNGPWKKVWKADRVIIVPMDNIHCSTLDECKAVVRGIQVDHMDNEDSLASLGYQS